MEMSKIDMIEEAKILKYLSKMENPKIVKTHRREFSICIPREPYKIVYEVSEFENAEVGSKRKRT